MLNVCDCDCLTRAVLGMRGSLGGFFIFVLLMYDCYTTELPQ